MLVAGGCGINADRDMVGSSSPRGTYVTTDSVDTHCGLRTPLVPKGIATSNWASRSRRNTWVFLHCTPQRPLKRLEQVADERVDRRDFRYDMI